jgi:hypothetical protein
MPARLTTHHLRQLLALTTAAAFTAAAVAVAAAGGPDAPAANLYSPFPAVVRPAEGISWPPGQALPTFAAPAATLDTILVQDLSRDEQLTFSALQGLVNRKQLRIYLLDARSDEGPFTWAETATVGFGSRTSYDRRTKFELLKRYVGEVKGVVLYDPSTSPHYRNLAGTVAGLERAIPVTAEIRESMRSHGVDLPVIVDLTTLGFTSPIEIYEHLHQQYWERCEKRFLVSAKPHSDGGGGDFHHTRDLAAACGAAVVWLDTLDPAERAVLGKFLGDMKAGEAVVLGWYATERSGVTTASAFGIGTIPADHYISGSVYAGTDPKIMIPPVPRRAELADKVYVTMFISDGDNIQYTQRAMRRIWDRSAPSRGKMPLNWTIAPALVDVGPAILNYYYSTATANDCFVGGPSGMGYLMPFNTLREPGAPVGVVLEDPAKMAAYARLTETYLQRSGLRVVTIWDDATPMHRAAYAEHCRNLYGATVQNFRDVRGVRGSVQDERVRFDRLVIPYAGTYEHLSRSLAGEIGRWDGKSPRFLAYQADVWGELKPAKLVELHDEFSKRHPGTLEFVRADHYFALYQEAEGLPFNLCMSASTTVTSGDATADVGWVVDGSPAKLWAPAEPGPQWLVFDFGAEHEIHRCVVRHAGDHGPGRQHNTRDFRMQADAGDGSWQTVAIVTGNAANVSDVEFDVVTARRFRMLIDDPGADRLARIADVEIHGRRPPAE